jgi:hypothetical protein
MNDFLEELLGLALKRMDGAKSQSERSNWSRLAKRLDSMIVVPNENLDSGLFPFAEKNMMDLLCKYALWAAWLLNNRSPFHTGTIRRSRRIRPQMAERKRMLPKPIHARMLFSHNEHAKEYVEWISRKPNIFERPI